MTAVAPTLLADAAATVARAEAYILSRQSEAGGFCFYKSGLVDEPNLRDTYHAVAALTLLGATVPAIDRLVQFVSSSHTFDSGFLYWYAFTLDCLGRADAIDADRRARIAQLTIEVPKPGQPNIRQWLERALRVLRLRARFGTLPHGEDILHRLDALKSGGGYGAEPNLWETSLALGIRRCFGTLSDISDTRSFVDRLQAAPFGFALAAGSITGTLEVIEAGVKCCTLLDLPLRFTNDILHFVLACQSANGGFARAPDALPDLAQTHRALGVIQRIVSGRPGAAIPATAT
jgi:hypothetical protein